MVTARNGSRRGQSAVELIAGLTIFIPIIFVGIDIATLYMGAQLNSQVCRDAARAAAAGPPNVCIANQPFQRASQVVNKTLKTTGAIQMEQLTASNVVESVSPPYPQAPYGGTVNGNVTVSTTVDVYTPFIVGRLIGKTPVKINAQQTFPYTYVMASTFNQQTNNGSQTAWTGSSMAGSAPGSTSGSYGQQNSPMSAGSAPTAPLPGSPAGPGSGIGSTGGTGGTGPAAAPL